jgi:hypothetical protein
MKFPFSPRGIEQPRIMHVKRLPKPVEQSAIVGNMRLQAGVHGEFLGAGIAPCGTDISNSNFEARIPNKSE